MKLKHHPCGVQLEALIRGAKREFDLTLHDDQRSVVKLADAFIAADASTDEIQSLAGDGALPLEVRMATLLAESRRWLIANRERRLTLGVVFAMWGEHHRLRPKTAENSEI